MCFNRDFTNLILTLVHHFQQLLENLWSAVTNTIDASLMLSPRPPSVTSGYEVVSDGHSAIDTTAPPEPVSFAASKPTQSKPRQNSVSTEEALSTSVSELQLSDLMSITGCSIFKRSSSGKDEAQCTSRFRPSVPRSFFSANHQVDDHHVERHNRLASRATTFGGFGVLPPIAKPEIATTSISDTALSPIITTFQRLGPLPAVFHRQPLHSETSERSLSASCKLRDASKPRGGGKEKRLIRSAADIKDS